MATTAIIYDSVGKLIKSGVLTDKQINLQVLNPVAYVITISNGSVSISKK